MCFAGGSAISSTICQIILSDVLGRDVETIENRRHIGVMGAATLMAVNFGLIFNIKGIKKLANVTATYKPNLENNSIYNKTYPVFKNLYKDNKKSYEILNS